MSKTPLQELQDLYPKFKFENVSRAQAQLALTNGDSVQIMPSSTIEVDSKLVINLPNNSSIKTVVPSFEDLEMVGLIKKGSEVKATSSGPSLGQQKPAAESKPAASSQTSSSGSGSGSGASSPEK